MDQPAAASFRFTRTQAGLGLVASGAWSAALIEQWPRLTAIGPICGESSGFLSLLGHCPACYVATAASIGFFMSIAQTRLQPARALASRRSRV